MPMGSSGTGPASRVSTSRLIGPVLPEKPWSAGIMQGSLHVAAVVKRDRAIVLAGMAGLSALAWGYLLALAWREPHRDMAMAMAMPHMQVWGATEVLLTWVMWAVMMVAMMTPSAATMTLTFATINRRRRA